MKKITGVISQGLLGNLFPSMNMLAERLNKATPTGCHFTVYGGNDPYLYQSQIESVIDAAVARGDDIILMGHSLGADLMVSESARLAAKGIKVPVLGIVDPTCWDSNVGSAGRWEVGTNVGVCINPRQPFYPGGGQVYRAANNTTTKLQVMNLSYPHASLSGQDVGGCEETQSAMVAAVLGYIKSGLVAAAVAAYSQAEVDAGFAAIKAYEVSANLPWYETQAITDQLINDLVTRILAAAAEVRNKHVGQ